MPDILRDETNADVKAVLRKSEARRRMLTMHYAPVGGSAADRDAFLEAERIKVCAIICVGNIRIQQ